MSPSQRTRAKVAAENTAHWGSLAACMHYVSHSVAQSARERILPVWGHMRPRPAQPRSMANLTSEDRWLSGATLSCILLFLCCGAPSFLVLLLAVPSLVSGRNTGVFGSLSGVTATSYGKCTGAVQFEALIEQQILADVEMPCDVPFGVTPGTAIDLCYHRGDPQNVAYVGLQQDDEPACDVSYETAHKLVLATFILLYAWLLVTVVMLLVIWQSLKPAAYDASALASKEGASELSWLKAGAV